MSAVKRLAITLLMHLLQYVRLLVSASSSPCFDSNIQYSFRRCVIAASLIENMEKPKKNDVN